MTRLIEFICGHHRDSILNTRIWPDQADTCPDCSHCNARIRLLPDLDMMRCIAVHETGHAIAYLTLNCPVDALTLTSDGNGTVGFRSTLPQPVGVWAGMAALRRMLLNLGTPSAADLLDVIATGGVGPTSDAQQLHAMAASGVDIDAAREKADALVAEHWPAIERTAGQLLACGRLSGDEITAFNQVRRDASLTAQQSRS